MPCYTNVKTVMLDIEVIKKVAAELGIKVEKNSPHRYTLSKGLEHITIEREAEAQPFYTKRYSGSNSWDVEIIKPLLPAYARAQIKAVFKKAGYTVAAGAQPNQLQFTSYK